MPCPGLPPELWSRIITAAAVSHSPRRAFDWRPYFWNSVAIHDLRSFSLVSQALLYPAQSQLFRDIDLIAPLHFKTDPHQYELSRCLRLVQIMKESPHLTHHVRSISVTSDFEIYSVISDIKLSRLRIIQLRRPDYGVAESAMPPVPTFVGESIRHVQLCNFPHLSYTSLITILNKCPVLEGLHIHECAAIETEAFTPLATPTLAKVGITYLSLEYSGSVAQWFLRPEFPLTFSNLISVALSGSTNHVVTAVLESSQKTLQSVTLLADPGPHR
ncbi:hypothetical protein FB451DRAFT_1270632 [Mycena latifolia]|nr:hypothetical protein FB451DRAFT_1270632 [Mycena latifolia]